jgi:hypothetical protein
VAFWAEGGSEVEEVVSCVGDAERGGRLLEE